MDTSVCVWFILSECREGLVFVSDVLGLDVGFKCVWLKLGFVWTTNDGTF